MKHYAGLDVSIKETSVCVLDEGGRIVREVKVPSHPDDLAPVLLDLAHPLDRVGLEAGPLSQWLFTGLAEKGVPVVCIETRHTKAFLKAQPNKSDRNDARGIAQMMRVNLFRPVHVKTLRSQYRRVLLSASSCRRKRSPSRTTSAGCTQLRPEGRRRRKRRVRGAHPRARRRPSGASGNHASAPRRPTHAA